MCLRGCLRWSNASTQCSKSPTRGFRMTNSISKCERTSPNALAGRRSHGRHSTPVEVVLRLLGVSHLHQWSYQETEEQVDQNLILRWFCRLYWAPVPDDTTLIRWANTLQPETLHALNDRVVQLAVQARVTKGRKLRLDATCVQTNIHHPTDSGLLVDSVRVLSRIVQRAKALVKDQVRNVQQTCRSRLRSARSAA